MSECNKKDLLSSRWAMLLLWIGPWVLILSTGGTNSIIHAFVWTFAFSVAGVACLVNARRCGRLHCFFTGPVFLLAALASLLYGLDILPLGGHGWMWILDSAVVLSLLACCVLESLFGKYKTSGAQHA